MTGELDFFFYIGSTYTYLAVNRVEEVFSSAVGEIVDKTGPLSRAASPALTPPANANVGRHGTEL